MNHEFIMKMMQAKKLEYEALKEIMPEKMVNKISDLEKEIMDIAKEYAMSGFTDGKTNKSKSGESTGNDKVKRVNIES